MFLFYFSVVYARAQVEKKEISDKIDQVNSWGVCLTGGEAPGRKHVASLLAKSSFCVAADSGLDLAQRYGVVPDLVVGDMDSLQNLALLESFDSDRIVKYSHDKDDTDTEIALQKLQERGFDRLALIGGGGGRLDHLVAILSLFDRALKPDIWVTDESYVVSVETSVEIENRVGSGVSFFPVGAGPWRMISEGLQWPLDKTRWQRGDIGISNRITETSMKVSVKSGRLVMIGGLDTLPGVQI